MRLRRVCVCLLTLVLLTAVTPIFAGGQKEAVTPAVEAEIVGNEAPMLARQVEQGLIPPLDERMPDNPVVREPWHEVGRYGGTYTRFYTGFGDTANYTTIAFENMLGSDREQQSVIPNIAEDWAVSEDFQEYTLWLRQGVRWSDGHPFTADDVLFWTTDVVTNQELYPIPPAWFSTVGILPEVEKIDDYTVRIRFAHPHMFFHFHMGAQPLSAPKHHLKQFHPAYATQEELEAEVREAGLDDWADLFEFKQDWRTNSELPVLTAWMQDGSVRWGDERFQVVRNPYYWKVDTEGRQLPYLDQLRFEFVSNWDVAMLRMMAGEGQMQGRGSKLTDYPVYMESRGAGNYDVYEWNMAEVNASTLVLNLTYEGDTVLRDIFRDLRFRQALSLAMNRDQMNEAIWLGLGTPRQATIQPHSPFYQPEFEQAYTEYDVDRANQLLDEMGLRWDSRRQWRLRPDGQRLGFELDVRSGQRPEQGEMIKEYFIRIGVDVSVRDRGRELHWMRVAANEHQAVLFEAMADELLTRISVFTLDEGERAAHFPLWRRWMVTDGREGEQPPPEVVELIGWIEKLETAATTEERNEAGKEIIRINGENMWFIGIVGFPPYFFLVSNDFRNMPEEGMLKHYTWVLRHTYPETFYIRQ